jgi:hypothetical protein
MMPKSTTTKPAKTESTSQKLTDSAKRVGKKVSNVKNTPKKLVEHTLSTALNTVENAKEKQKIRKEKQQYRKEHPSKVQKAVKAVPQKLVEHTISTALNTVENAQIKEDVKNIKHTAKKIEKAINRAKHKKTAPILNTAKAMARTVKEKIKTALSKEEERRFYYDTRKLWALAVAYGLMAVLFFEYIDCPCVKIFLNTSAGIIATVITALLWFGALLGTFYVIRFKPTLAVVNAQGIKIDHNPFLHWQDIDHAEYRLSSSVLKRPFIALITKEGVTFNLTFMQRLCQHNRFTAFSLPLYAMTPQSAIALQEIVQKHTPLR